MSLFGFWHASGEVGENVGGESRHRDCSHTFSSSLKYYLIQTISVWNQE